MNIHIKKRKLLR